MQEITPLEAEKPRPFPTGAIIKEAWQISTKYFWPLTMAIFVIQLPERILICTVKEKQSWQISAWYEMLVSGFVFVGIHRSIYKLKSEGITPTFAGIFEEGQPYYGRNFRMSWIANLMSVFLIGIIAALMIPGAFAFRNGSDAPSSYVLPGIISLAGLLIVAWWAIRIFMCRAVLADDAAGAMKAIGQTFSLSKGKVLTLAPVVMSQAGIYLAWLILHMMTYLLIVGDLVSDVPKSTDVKITLATSFPLAFVQILTSAITALTYLHLKKTSKPAEQAPATAPADETPPA